MDHLAALEFRLSNERGRLAQAKTVREIEFRKAQVESCEREIAGELKFLGKQTGPVPDLTDDELLAELFDKA